jgi:hypothetical protein
MFTHTPTSSYKPVKVGAISLLLFIEGGYGGAPSPIKLFYIFFIQFIKILSQRENVNIMHSH